MLSPGARRFVRPLNSSPSHDLQFPGEFSDRFVVFSGGQRLAVGMALHMRLGEVFFHKFSTTAPARFPAKTLAHTHTTTIAAAHSPPTTTTTHTAATTA